MKFRQADSQKAGREVQRLREATRQIGTGLAEGRYELAAETKRRV